MPRLRVNFFWVFFFFFFQSDRPTQHQKTHSTLNDKRRGDGLSRVSSLATRLHSVWHQSIIGLFLMSLNNWKKVYCLLCQIRSEHRLSLRTYFLIPEDLVEHNSFFCVCSLLVIYDPSQTTLFRYTKFYLLLQNYWWYNKRISFLNFLHLYSYFLSKDIYKWWKSPSSLYMCSQEFYLRSQENRASRSI